MSDLTPDRLLEAFGVTEADMALLDPDGSYAEMRKIVNEYEAAFIEWMGDYSQAICDRLSADLLAQTRGS